MQPRISILMGIFNCAPTLPEAIDSILNQTYPGWKLILCDDGSGDDTYAVAKRYQEQYPEQIILIQNERNMGLNFTLNHCLEYADTEYIARMDGDDISLPGRLEQELRFLDEHPDYAIVSCPMIYFDENGDWGRGTAIADPTKEDFVSGTPFCHAPCMVRAEAFRAAKGYSTDLRTLRAEDYNLWFRLYALGYKGHNLREPLYKMRDDQNAYHRRKFKYARNEFYVRWTGYRMLKLPKSSYLYAFRPLIVGLLPKPVYLFLHHRRMGK